MTNETTAMYVILTSKIGQYHTEVGEGLKPIEAYDYVFFGRHKAHFVIAEISGEIRITIVDEAPPPVVNVIPSKFLPKYASVEAARRELQQLADDTAVDVVLRRVAH